MNMSGVHYIKRCHGVMFGLFGETVTLPQNILNDLMLALKGIKK